MIFNFRTVSPRGDLGRQKAHGSHSRSVRPKTEEWRECENPSSSVVRVERQRQSREESSRKPFKEVHHHRRSKPGRTHWRDDDSLRRDVAPDATTPRGHGPFASTISIGSKTPIVANGRLNPFEEFNGHDLCLRRLRLLRPVRRKSQAIIQTRLGSNATADAGAFAPDGCYRGRLPDAERRGREGAEVRGRAPEQAR
jgi:hypothetical protein